MDKLVKRVTVVQGSGQNRSANVVYESDEDDDSGENKLERAIRHILKAQVIGAQEAYQRHLDSVAKGGKSWIFDEPSNLMKAQKKAMKEMRKAAPRCRRSKLRTTTTKRKEMTMANPATGSGEQAREHEKAGKSQIVVVELGEAQSSRDVKRLRKGKASSSPASSASSAIWPRPGPSRHRRSRS